jgi:outer membrane lipoprotein-sorting protein
MTKGRNITKAVALSLAAGWLLIGVPSAQADDRGTEIMSKVAESRRLAGSEAIVEMRIVNEKGETRTRKLKMATKLTKDGTEKRVYRFLEPDDVKGTGVLVFDHEKKADDIWIFLPALRKSRRVVASERSQSFMGSEFTYGDLNIPVLTDYTYKYLGEEATGGENCYKVEVVPKPGTNDGYKKKTYWVSKKSYAVRRGLYYNKAGKLWKELKTQDIKLLDKDNSRYRATRMEMINRQDGRRSVFVTRQIAFKPNTKEEYFTTRFLERQ